MTKLMRFKVGQRIWTPRGEGRTTNVEDLRENDGDFMWTVMLDTSTGPEQHEDMFFERNLRHLIPCSK